MLKNRVICSHSIDDDVLSMLGRNAEEVVEHAKRDMFQKIGMLLYDEKSCHIVEERVKTPYGVQRNYSMELFVFTKEELQEFFEKEVARQIDKRGLK